MNKIQSWPVACSLRYLWYLYIPLLRALSLRIFTRSQVALNARWKVSENVFRMFDSTFSFVIFKILKFNFRNCCQIVVQNFQKVWKFDGKIRGIRIIRIRKNSIFLIEPLLFILFRSTKIPTRLSSSHTTGYYFFICSQLVRGKKEKQVNREFRGCCGEPVEFSSVKSLSGLRFRCAFCGPATSCQTWKLEFRIKGIQVLDGVKTWFNFSIVASCSQSLFELFLSLNRNFFRLQLLHSIMTS